MIPLGIANDQHIDKTIRSNYNSDPLFDNYIEDKLHRFITSEIDKFDPDLVILVERKGTAIIRALKESERFNFSFTWSKIISSCVIEQLSIGYFVKKKVRKILILDDMMREGKHLEYLLEVLFNKFSNEIDPHNIRIAVFAVHSKSSHGKPSIYLPGNYPHSWYYTALDDKRYSLIRYQLVEFLERTGSLMLDTEHIELRFKINRHFNDVIKALNREGSHTVVFKSSKNRKNITVYYDDKRQLSDELMKVIDDGQFPYVKKCRIVQRKNEFAIIPICYPSINSKISQNNLPGDYHLLFPGSSDNGMERFYQIGLYSALEVLKWTIKDLMLTENGISDRDIETPVVDANDNPEKNFTLNHLTVMFPSLDLEYLKEKIDYTFNSAINDVIKIRGRKFLYNKHRRTNDDELIIKAFVLLVYIKKSIDSRKLSNALDGKEIKHPFGLQVHEIFEIAKQLGIVDEAEISSLFDILIDKSALVTHVQKLEFDNGETRYTRTFEPDGECIDETIQKYLLIYGLPNGFKNE
jgi:hypothetical protein